MSVRLGEPAVHVRAPGKLGLYVGVGDAAGEGYHEVAGVYQAVSLYENLVARAAADFSVSLGGTVDTRALGTGAHNLAVKAARLLARHTGYRGGVALSIEKNIPVSGGLAGASADAAAALVACDALWGTSCSREDLHQLAARLGPEVPFALVGGTAIGTGHGEELSPVLAQGSFDWVLVLPDAGLATSRVYRELDAHRARHAGDIPRAGRTPAVATGVLQALRAGDPHMLAEALSNDLQAPAIHLVPQLAEILELGERAGALAGTICGSGPTVAFLTAGHDEALEVQIALSSAMFNAARVTGPVHGTRLISA